jgi:hypothetical protein
MKLTENQLRSITRRIIKELFTRKDRLSFRGMTDYDIDPYDYSGDGDFDGDGLGESDDLEEVDDIEEEDKQD